jgi:dTMP kinase
MKGKFIVFEGIGGCGKGTQVELLRKYLVEELGKEVFVTCEHTRDTPTGILIEEILKKIKAPIAPVALQLLFIADRANHTDKTIKPALEKYEYVISDRYQGSAIAYAPRAMRRYICATNLKIIARPDAVVILDLDPREAVNRVESRGDADIFDRVEKLKRCRLGYKWYSKKSGDPCLWIDASGSKEEIFERVVKGLKSKKIIK